MFLLNQELDEIRLIEVVVLAKMIPGVANVLLLLLEGHLIADGIGLVSHGFLRMLVGIAVGSGFGGIVSAA